MSKKENIICDTSPPPMNPLDTSMTIEGMLNEQRNEGGKESVTISLERWKVNALRVEALKETMKTNGNVNYSDLIRRAIDEKYFLKNEEINKNDTK